MESAVDRWDQQRSMIYAEHLRKRDEDTQNFYRLLAQSLHCFCIRKSCLFFFPHAETAEKSSVKFYIGDRHQILSREFDFSLCRSNTARLGAEINLYNFP